MASNEESGASYEAQHVHDVYERIAPHFSSTRYKPWPFINQFLLSLPSGSVGLDAGCGNGKYLHVNPSLYIVASDRSHNLLRIASDQVSQRRDLRHSAVVADCLNLPHPRGRFDFALSVAVVHHLSTRSRRVGAVRELLRCLKPTSREVLSKARSKRLNQANTDTEPEGAQTETSHDELGWDLGGPHPEDGGGSKALIYAWALEQKSSRRGWDENHSQDVMVPWVMQKPARDAGDEAQEGDDTVTLNRYYHLYREGELPQDIRDAGGTLLASGYERDNWWAIAVRMG
ncbi:MAG: tRNA methyltransferase, has a role in tRNA modification [Alyxoria varia]|nr:MAG: tRNA methyltransferase, has a role in tRNA modification [Alyxoria varia]